MSIPRPISGTNLDTVTRDVVRLARARDYRARRVAMVGRPGVVRDRMGIVTPHRDHHGELDADDLAAQVYAIALETRSVSGSFDGGSFCDESACYFVAAPVETQGHGDPD